MNLRSTTLAKPHYQPKQAPTIVKKYNDDNYDYSWQCNQGLPNMGNTCFLNSAIQFLYSSSIFKNAIMQTKAPKSSFQYNLANIFFCIQNQRTFYEKHQILGMIIEFLRNKHADYEVYSQQDCFQFILLILDTIGQKYPEILQFFKLYYKYVCSHCKNASKRKQYIIFSQNIFCEQCRCKMSIRYISTPKCIIAKTLYSHKKQMKIITVDEKEITYKLVAKVIYIGNGNFGHYKVSRRRSLGKYGDKFFTFSDSFIHEQRYSFYGGSYQKTLLALYEIDTQPEQIEIQPEIHKPMETARMNAHLSKIYTDSVQRCNNHIQKQRRQSIKDSVIRPKVEKPKSPIKKQIKFDFKYIFDKIGLLPLGEIVSVYSRIKSLYKIISEMTYNQGKIVQFIKSIFFNFSNTKTYDYLFKKDQRIMHESNNIKQCLQIFQINKNQRLIRQIVEKLPQVLKNENSQQFSQSIVLKTVLFIGLTVILTFELPKLNDSFKFTFRYYCLQCYRQTYNGEGYFLTNQTFFCCKKPLDFKRFYFIKKPTYLIYINETDKNQKSYEFNVSNHGYPVQYQLKSSISLSPLINFEICEQNTFKVEISPPLSCKRHQLYCSNQTLKSIFHKYNLNPYQYLLQTKKNVKINQSEEQIPLSTLENMELNQIQQKYKSNQTFMTINYCKFNINVKLMN